MQKGDEMQEICVNIKFYDIRDGEYPTKDGWYLTEHYTPFEHMGLLPMYWENDKKVWLISPESKKEFEPNEYAVYLWTEYFLEGVKE